MFKVMIRYTGGQVSGKKTLKSEKEALQYFKELCKKRTDHPASAVILNMMNQALKTYRVDRDFAGDRLTKNEPIKKNTQRFLIPDMPIELAKEIEKAAEEEGISPEEWAIEVLKDKFATTKKGFW